MFIVEQINEEIMLIQAENIKKHRMNILIFIQSSEAARVNVCLSFIVRTCVLEAFVV
jgi:hypothetical protein